jgi:ribosomal protein L37AE/L43A
MVTTTRFKSVVSTKTIKGNCNKCGKKNRSYTIKEEQTINPFNTDSSGIPKTRRAILAECNDHVTKLIERHRKNFICKSCERNYLTSLEKEIEWFGTSRRQITHPEETV